MLIAYSFVNIINVSTAATSKLSHMTFCLAKHEYHNNESQLKRISPTRRYMYEYKIVNNTEE